MTSPDADWEKLLEHAFGSMPRVGRPRERVRAGDVLGHAGVGDAGFRSLDFELWRRNDEGEFDVLDPTSEMLTWLVLPWTDDRMTPMENTVPVAA